MEINKKFLPVLDKIAPIIDNSLNKTTPVILKLTDYFANLFNTIGNNPAIQILKNEIALLNKDIQTFIAGNPEFVKALKEGFDWLISSGVPTALAGITKALRGVMAVFSAINNLFKGIADIIGKIGGTILSIPNIIQTVFINMINTIMRTLIPMFKLINEAKMSLADSANNARNFMDKVNNSVTKNDNRSFSTVNNDNRTFGGHTFNISTRSNNDLAQVLQNAGYAMPSYK